MLKTMTFEIAINEQRKLEIDLPHDAPLGMASVIVVVPTTPLPSTSESAVAAEPDEDLWNLLLTMGDRAVEISVDSPTDIADRHDDYLYGEV